MNFLQRFMYGRYGVDHLSFALLFGYFILNCVRSLTHIRPFSWAAWVLLLVAALRILSRNISRRRQENTRFLNLVLPVVRWVKMRVTIHSDKEHRYFRCPNCGRYLRVPRGKGRINITCRSCGASFEAKS